MARWKHGSKEDLDKLAKREKVRKASKGRGSDSSKEQDFELSEKHWSTYISDGCFAARVVEVHKRYAFVSVESVEGEVDSKDIWIATVARTYLQTDRKERNFFSVGDRVLCSVGGERGHELSEDLPTCTIIRRSPRRSKLARLDPMTPEREHVLACNFDQLVIVSSFVFPKVKWGLIDRYLTLSEEQNIPAIILLNKKDLLLDQKEDYQEVCKYYMDLYKSLGYQVHSVQAFGGDDSDAQLISGLLNGKISFFTGHSGVGKSSIINLMEPEIRQDVETEEIITKGRHTTTYASFIKLKQGGYVIDSPGIRSFLIKERTAVELSWCFVELRPFLNQCKYRECKHITEDQCAVKKAVIEEKISQVRYESYLALLTGATGREGRLRDHKVE